MKKRRTFTAKEKANIVLEMLREERTTAELASAYGIHSTVLARWKTEALDNLPSLFTRGPVKRKRQQYEKEKEQLTQHIGQLSWLKKKSVEALKRRREKGNA